jgi:hypothetical protein
VRALSKKRRNLNLVALVSHLSLPPTGSNPLPSSCTPEQSRAFWRSPVLNERGEWNMRKSLLIAALIGAVATPAFAEEVGVHVGPVGAGVTVGEDHDHYRDRDHTTVIKEREPRDRTTVIKKEDADGNREKTVIHHDDHN